MLIFSWEYTPWECGLGHSILSPKAHIIWAEWIKWGVWTCGWKNIPVLILIFSWCLTGINYHFNMVSAGLHPTTAIHQVEFLDEDTALISLTILNSSVLPVVTKLWILVLTSLGKKNVFLSIYKTYNHFNMTNSGECRDSKIRERHWVGWDNKEREKAVVVSCWTCRPFVCYIVWNPNPAQVMAYVLVTLKERFHSEFNMGFLLTHRQSVSAQSSLYASQFAPSSVLGEPLGLLGLHCFTSVDACEYLQPCSTVQDTHLWSLAFASKEWII